MSSVRGSEVEMGMWKVHGTKMGQIFVTLFR
jgi:hypothetical protein